jgi:predicted Fe-Mo cluster-binding NifX family protein
MKFAVPLDSKNELYRYNPCSASKFAIYTIHGNSKELTYAFLNDIDNPWLQGEGDMMCDPKMRMGECDDELKKNLQHITEHYALLEVINGCDYLLVQSYCENTRRAMKNAGVKLIQIPPFIRKTENAIKNFLVGAKIADSIKYIHYAS